MITGQMIIRSEFGLGSLIHPSVLSPINPSILIQPAYTQSMEYSSSYILRAAVALRSGS